MDLNILTKDLTNDDLAKNQGNIIRYCKNKPVLYSIISEKLFESVSLYSKEITKDDVFLMVGDLIEDYKNDPIEIIINVIKKIRKGHIKIYGKVTPFDLRELIKKELEEISIIKENNHSGKKGFFEKDMTPRSSGRLSDYFDKNKLQSKFKIQ